MKKLFTISLLLILAVFDIYSQGWFQQSSGTGNDLSSISVINQNLVYVCGNGGVILKTTNGGDNWISLNSGNPYPLYSIFFINSNTGYSGGALGILLKTTNGGLNWTNLNPGAGTAYIRSIYFPPSEGGNLGYVIYEQPSLIVKTTNEGSNWSLLASGTSYQYSVFCVSATLCFISASTGIVAKSTDGGSGWILHNTQDPGSMKSVHFNDENTGWTVSSSSKIYKSTNSGTNWQMVFNTAGCGLNSVYFPNTQTGWTAGCEGVIYHTSNSGTNWTQQSMGTTTSLNDIKFADTQTGWAAGANGRILKTVTGGVVGISVIQNEIPSEFLLQQNYPNPFNPGTNIRFNLPEKSFVKVSVFNTLGKELEVLVNQTLFPAVYEIKWNAESYPSGVYFYRIDAENYTQTRKMILVK